MTGPAESHEYFNSHFTLLNSILLALLVTILLKGLPIYLKWNCLRIKCDKIIGPTQLPLIGNLLALASKSTYGE
jgi:hypothetical protein